MTRDEMILDKAIEIKDDSHLTYRTLEPLRARFEKGTDELADERRVEFCIVYAKAAIAETWANEAEYIASKGLEIAVDVGLKEDASILTGILLGLYLDRSASMRAVRLGDAMLEYCEIDEFVNNFAFELCCAYFIEGFYTDAQVLAARKLQFCEDYGEVNDPRTSWLYYFIYNYGEVSDPKAVLDKWHAFQCSLYGENSPEAQEVVCHIALNRAEGGDCMTAIELFESALEILEQGEVTFRVEGISWYLMMFALVLDESGETQRGLEYLKKALEACDEDFGDDSEYSERIQDLIEDFESRI